MSSPSCSQSNSNSSPSSLSVNSSISSVQQQQRNKKKKKKVIEKKKLSKEVIKSYICKEFEERKNSIVPVSVQNGVHNGVHNEVQTGVATGIQTGVPISKETGTVPSGTVLDFSICLSFTNHLKILLEIHKKISKTITFYIMKNENKQGLIFSNSNSGSNSGSNSNKSINLRSVFYKESFIEFYTSSPYIQFTLCIYDVINKLKNVKKNHFLRIYRYTGNGDRSCDSSNSNASCNKLFFDNIPIFQLKLNRIFEDEFLEIPSSGVFYNYVSEGGSHTKKQEIECQNYTTLPLEELGLKQDEKLYFESFNEIAKQSRKDFVTNSNQLCKIISFFNKKKFSNITFIIETYRSVANEVSIDFLKLKGYKDRGSDKNLNPEEKTVLLYTYENFNKEKFELSKCVEYDFPLSNFVYFIKIKNLNQETNNNIKIRFYKKNLFIESIVNNCGLFTVNIS